MTKEVSRLTNLIRKFRHHYSLYIVRKLWVHWFNPFYTLYFNLIFLPLKQAICFPVFIYGWPRLYAQMGHIKCIDECYPGMVRINLSFPGGPQCYRTYDLGDNYFSWKVCRWEWKQNYYWWSIRDG